MAEHFIKNIEIRNFKCFENFTAEGLGRVNLIGGKNNVGKTAFMEACFLIQNAYKYPTPEDRELFYFEIIKWLLILEENRKTVDFLIEWVKDEFELIDFSKFSISIPSKFTLESDENVLIPRNGHGWNYGGVNLSKYRDNKHFYQIYKKNNSPQIYNSTFVTPCATNHTNLKEMIDTLKIEAKYDSINTLLNEIFSIERIDIIKNKVMLQQNGTFKDLNHFGDGLKHFSTILLTLMVNKDNVIYLDEVDNGIHYTLFDTLWELILTISKQQNVQVFATTHSKECIESYARVAKKLEDEEVTYLRMSRLKDGSLHAGVRDYNMLQYVIDDEHEVR